MDDHLVSLQVTVNALQESLDDFRQEMNQKLDRLYTHIDGFINLHQRIDVELAALRAKQERIEERLVKLELVKP